MITRLAIHVQKKGGGGNRSIPPHTLAQRFNSLSFNTFYINNTAEIAITENEA